MRSSARSPRPITTLILYDDPSSETLDLEEIGNYLQNLLSVDVQLRGEFINHHLRRDPEEVAGEIATAKVRSLTKPHARTEPLLGEVEFEKRMLSKPEKRLTGILYDAYCLDAIYRRLIPKEERSLDTVHIVFICRLFGTFDESDGRYHARVILCGFPSLISTTGIVEAPAKPREFYLLRQRYAVAGMTPPTEALKEESRTDFLEYDDPRLTEAMKGYALQAVIFQAIGDPFCSNEDCRLYNAHWQSELIRAQLESGELCDLHMRIVETLKGREGG